jgi:hypothetical protein
MKPFNLRFDANGKLTSPLKTQPWRETNARLEMTTGDIHQPFADLSEYFGDIPNILAQQERDQATTQLN